MVATNRLKVLYPNEYSLCKTHNIRHTQCLPDAHLVDAYHLSFLRRAAKERLLSFNFHASRMGALSLFVKASVQDMDRATVEAPFAAHAPERLTVGLEVGALFAQWRGRHDAFFEALTSEYGALAVADAAVAAVAAMAAMAAANAAAAAKSLFFQIREIKTRI